jgi:outer membrane protein with beta-barrel domain
MKKITLLALCFSAVNTFAQNGFFLQPAVGLGFSNIKEGDFPGKVNPEKVFAYSGEVGLGYHLKNIDLNTGIGYLRTGAMVPMTVTSSPASSYAYTFNSYHYFYHITVPVGIAYRFRLTEKLRIAPGASLALSYNLGEKNNAIQNGDQSMLVKMPGDEFDATYKRLSVFGTAKCHVEYSLKKNIDFIAGPSFCYMLTNMYKVPAGAPYISRQNNYALLLNAGVKYAFPRKLHTNNFENTTLGKQ